MRYIPNEKPRVLRDTEARIDARVAKTRAEAEAEQSRYAANARRYNAAKFWRGEVYISDLFKGWIRGFFDSLQTVNDSQNAFWESSIDAGWYDGLTRDAWQAHGDDALALFRYMCPDAPITAERRDTIRGDLARAVAEASRGDMESQFYDWMVRHIEDAAEESGLRWTLLDAFGAPTKYPCEANRIGFSCTRAEYLDKAQPWGGYVYAYDNETRRERMEDADNRMSEYLSEEIVSEAARNGTPDDFDPRGSRYGDADDWPILFMDSSEACDAWKSDVRKMRKKLRAAIAARAPLQVRADIVATVYGAPGEPDNDGDDD